MKRLIIGVMMLMATSCFAACPTLYPNNKVIEPKDTVELCNSFYVSRFNPKTNAVILTSEIVQPRTGGVERSDNFRADLRVRNPVSPITYKRSGYDKGHMAPAGDAPDDLGMSESFLMTNMTPQVPDLNRGAWREIEEQMRNAVASVRRPTHIVTGAVCRPTPKIVGNVPVPVAYFKVAYLPNVVIIYAENKNNASVEHIASLQALRKRIGTNYGL